MIQNLINHIALIVDRSGSMSGQPVVKVFDKELQALKQRSIELNQETRISVYLFDSTVECLIFDMDVMRFKSLEGHYKATGSTALIDAVMQSVKDHVQLPQMYGDHAFLQYVITDGQENQSRHTGTDLKQTMSTLPDNWTVACLVPDSSGVFEAKKFGFNSDSIAIWSTTVGGMEKAGTQFSSAMANYMTMRSTGVRSTKGLFTLNSTGVKKRNLKPLDARKFQLFPVRKEQPIKEFVEYWTGEPYRIRSAYYQPTKPVEVQAYKDVLVQDVKNGRVYEGSDLRQLLGLPDATVKVNPGQHKDWNIFIQSTSVNRKLFPETFVLVRK